MVYLQERLQKDGYRAMAREHARAYLYSAKSTVQSEKLSSAKPAGEGSGGVCGIYPAARCLYRAGIRAASAAADLPAGKAQAEQAAESGGAQTQHRQGIGTDQQYERRPDGSPCGDAVICQDATPKLQSKEIEASM